MKRTFMRVAALMLALASLLSLAGCAATPTTTGTSAPAVTTSTAAPTTTPATTTPPAATTTKAPTPAPTTTTAPDKVLLVVSFGTSYNDSRELTIGGVEKALQAAYPGYKARRAFTSQIIIDKLKKRDNLSIDNVKQAMDRLVADGIKEVVIQPTHVMTGFEYDDVIAEVTPYASKFTSFKVGKSLLAADAAYDDLVAVLIEETKAYAAKDTAVVFMGHGTEHKANDTYAKIQKKLKDAGQTNIFIGTVEAKPDLDDVLALVKKAGAKKVVLLPLMIVAGDHANNDMAGDEDDSWKSVFEKKGYKVECVLKGLGQYAGVQKMFVKQVGELIAK